MSNVYLMPPDRSYLCVLANLVPISIHTPDVRRDYLGSLTPLSRLRKSSLQS